MDLPTELHCLFSATVEERDESYVVEVPKREIRVGSVDDGQTVRVGLLPALSDGESTDVVTEPEPASPDQPLEVGETRTVDIEGIGDQGDGIARVERGFVVIVPDTSQGERVTVEVTEVTESVAFAEVRERQSHL
jgi:predicted RNA-binding protein with TRAM domain